MQGTMKPHTSTLSQYRRLLEKYLAFQRPRLALLALLLFGSIALQLVNPQILRFFVDAARAGSSLDVLLQAALLFFAIAVVSQVVSIAATYVSQWVSFAATNQMRADLAQHCLSLDMPFHNQRTPGEMIQRIDGDVATLGNLFSNMFLLLAGNALLLVAVLVVLWFQEWRMGLVLTIWAACALLALNVSRVRAVPLWRAVSQAGAEFWGFLEERLGGVEDIRANGAAPYVLRQMAILIRTLYVKVKSASLMGTAVVSTYLAVYITGNVIALGLGGYLFIQGAMTLGTVYLVYAYTGFIVMPLRALADQFQYLQQAGASVQRVQELFDTRSQLAEPGVPAHLPKGALDVAFANVAFAYGDGKEVVHDISFRVARGKVLGVLGRTGSGKTTLARLVFRLYEPARGAICLGGVDIDRVGLAELRQRVALVTQEVQLFHATVRDNLAFFDPSISDERMMDALRVLGLGDWFDALPQGLDTLLASGGGGLSAGQAQLLAFARAFLRDPSVVILDEASSRLDPATEHLIERAVDRLLEQRTGIVIAHHLATVQRSDEILILEEGCVRELGNREQLARDPSSRFYQLLQTGLQEVLT